jgi:uncharacterized protein YneF (UPF0154 family)
MEKVMKVALGIILSAVAVLLFFFIRAMYCQYWFSTLTLSKEIAPLDILNIVVSGLIAIWLGYYITKKLTEQRFLKEFVIKDIYRIEEQIESFEKLIRVSNVTAAPIFNELNDLKHRIERFEQTVKLTPLSCSEIKNLNTCHTKLYMISTENTILPFGSINELQKICDDFVVCLRRIVCTINNK